MPSVIQSCVTLSLVPEARGGPFIFWGDLPGACMRAATLGFDAIEVFAPSAAAIDRGLLRRLLADHRLKLAALGTGAGWFLHRWTLTHPDAAVRAHARRFVADMMDVATEFGASTILGSMQGRWEGAVSREQALAWLREALEDLDVTAARRGGMLLYEPLNRYETNVLSRADEAMAFLRSLPTTHVRILADLFHMNIEESSIPAGLRTYGKHLGHVHFVDSNRRPAGAGHIDLVAVAATLTEIGFQGYASAEALPHPNPDAAALQSIETFRACFGTRGPATTQRQV